MKMQSRTGPFTKEASHRQRLRHGSCWRRRVWACNTVGHVQMVQSATRRTGAAEPHRTGPNLVSTVERTFTTKLPGVNHPLPVAALSLVCSSNAGGHLWGRNLEPDPKVVALDETTTWRDVHGGKPIRCVGKVGPRLRSSKTASMPEPQARSPALRWEGCRGRSARRRVRAACFGVPGPAKDAESGQVHRRLRVEKTAIPGSGQG